MTTIDTQYAKKRIDNLVAHLGASAGSAAEVLGNVLDGTTYLRNVDMHELFCADVRAQIVKSIEFERKAGTNDIAIEKMMLAQAVRAVMNAPNSSRTAPEAAVKSIAMATVHAYVLTFLGWNADMIADTMWNRLETDRVNSQAAALR